MKRNETDPTLTRRERITNWIWDHPGIIGIILIPPVYILAIWLYIECLL